MTLLAYNAKRSADKTPEPFGGKPNKTRLCFVIQKHAASHLHYDFRLEMEGVLKSWAVPKGPSTDPSVKRLAMMVEDHPYDYRNFEGIIPQGEYGGGTVIVWDEGTYEPIEKAKGKAAQEKLLLAELKSGSLKIVLHGKKLQGEFALVKTKGMADNAWLLIKHNDEFATDKDITLEDRSVKSDLTIDEMAASFEENAAPNPKAKAAKPTRAANKKAHAAVEKTIENLSEDARAARFPKFFTPMLAELTEAPPSSKDYVFEVKFDGYRAIAFMHKQKVNLLSRNEKSFNEKFFPVTEALTQWGEDAVLDGEVVCLRADGTADFEALQNWKSPSDGILVYYVFDIVWHRGKDVSTLPLEARKKLLKTILPEGDVLRYSEAFDVDGERFLGAAREAKQEGIMAKKRGSTYEKDSRGHNWLKIKVAHRQEAVIVGYTKNKGTVKGFSALLLAVNEDGKLRYIGKAGTGFSEDTQQKLLQLFASRKRKTPAVEDVSRVGKRTRYNAASANADVFWLTPDLICEVNFTELTKEGIMRHPSFKGLREDKSAGDVVLETPKKLPEEKMKKPAKSSPKATLFLPQNVEDTEVSVGGHPIAFSNLDKLYWKKEGIKKRDMLEYYHAVAPYILPYLKNRPESLNRFPNGIEGKSFYQKDVTGKVPEFMKTYAYKTDDDPQQKNFLLADDEATLLFMANLGCIEIHPWNSTIKKPDHPTWCVIDLDPDQNSFDQVVDAALYVHEILDAAGCDNYCKTSGSTGLHIYIPLGAKYDYDQSKSFAELIVGLVHEEMPEFTSLERSVRSRKGKMYLDFLQNRPHATLAAPYSLRPKPGAPVSMPLHWSEVKHGLKISDFNIFNAMERVTAEGDLFAPVLGKGINLKKVLNALSANMK